MVFRRRYRIRRFKRRFVRKRRFLKFRRARPIGSGDAGKRFFKLRRSDDVTIGTDANSSVVRQDNPNTAQDWSNVAALFDFYRCCAIKLHFIPAANVNEFPAGAAGPRFSPAYVFHDANSISSIIGVNNVIQYENLVVKNLWLPWKKYYKMTRNIPTSGTNAISSKGYVPTASPIPTQSVQIYIPTIGTQSSGVLGQLITTYYVVARNRN